jgi:hypothetical protein
MEPLAALVSKRFSLELFSASYFPDGDKTESHSYPPIPSHSALGLYISLKANRVSLLLGSARYPDDK